MESLTINDVKTICSGKRIFIWGAMIVGQGVCRSFERIGLKVESFIDSSPSLQGMNALGYPIKKPEDAFDTVRTGNGIIIAASGHCDFEIAGLCIKQGFTHRKDYIMSRELNDIDPSIDVAGMCNLKCISCPRGNDKNQPQAGLMSVETYRKVLKKLMDEIPMLGSIQLYAWGEPLLNPELPEIITITRNAKVLTAISSNLNYGKNLEKVVEAKPDWFKISCSGWGKTYEITHTGGKWEVFLENVHKLVEFRDKLHPEMQITLNYHLYKHNIGNDYHQMEKLCNDLSLIFRPSPAYLYPVDALMEYVKSGKLSPEAEKTVGMLLMGLDEGLKKALDLSSRPCPEDRCFPINWDCKVRTCGVFFHPFISDNFLEEPLSEILERKRKSQLCADCMKLGLHQFTGVYLAEKRLYNGNIEQ